MLIVRRIALTRQGGEEGIDEDSGEDNSDGSNEGVCDSFFSGDPFFDD